MVSWLRAAIEGRRAFGLGELWVEPAAGGWSVSGPASAGVPQTLGCEADSVLAHLRFDGTGGYRPLSGARTLPGGWRVDCPDDGTLLSVIDTIYPLATAHIDAGYSRTDGKGALRVVALEDTLRRQSGRYETAAALSPGGRAAAARELCGQCVRTPVWAGERPGANAVPCPEACSVLVALCREAALWEADPPASTPIDPVAGFAHFEQPGNAIREAVITALRLAPVPGAPVPSSDPSRGRTGEGELLSTHA